MSDAAVLPDLTPGQAFREKQALPLDQKVEIARYLVREWYDRWGGKVYVAFSGGKDSTALLHLVRSVYPEVPAVFFNTGLEFPEIVQFVKGTPNVTWVRPRLTFKQVIEKYGYPIPSKEQAGALRRYRNARSEEQRQYRLHGFPNGPKGKIAEKWKYLIDAPFRVSDQCCGALKERPGTAFARDSGLVRITGEMAGDSDLRLRNYRKHGCNAYGLSSPVSRPLSVWREEDVWEYLRRNGVPCSSIYEMGYRRTGCVFCGFGVCREQAPNRFQRMRQTHPKLWRYCMEDLGMRWVLDYVGVACE